MRTIGCLFIYLLVGMLPALAATPPLSAPLFGGVQFGDPPRDDMLCVAGPCPTGQVAIGHRNSGQLMSIYQLPVAESQLGRVVISTPQFFFYQDQLVRIYFDLDCNPDTAETCMQVMADTLNEYYALTLVSETYNAPAPQMAWLVKRYRTAAGQAVTIQRTMHKGIWSPPSVDYNDPTLSDQVRLVANPKYRSHVE